MRTWEERDCVGRTSCPSGKVTFTTRKIAKRHAHKIKDKHMRPYRCPDCDLFHLGHLPYVVRHGLQTADEWYGRVAGQDDPEVKHG